MANPPPALGQPSTTTLLRSPLNTNRSSAGSTGLYDLPPELLDWIVSYAAHVDLLNLSLVCKSLNKLVTPRLFSEYRNANLQYRRKIENFLFRILQDPSLANHVRHVELGVWNNKKVFLHPGFQSDIPSMPDDQFQTLAEAAKQTGLVSPAQDCQDIRPIKKNADLWVEYGASYDSDGYTSDDLPDVLERGSDVGSETPPPRQRPHCDVEFLRCLKRGIEDPKVLLLLAKLPRLRELSLRGPHLSQGLAWDKLREHSLKNLTKIKLAGNSSETPWDVAELSQVIRLPSLRELHGYMATSDEWDDVVNKSLEVEPNSLSLTHMYFERCAIGPKTIKNLIQGCSALEAFSYVSGGRFVGYEQFLPKEAKRYLLNHKATLKYLALDLSQWDFPRKFKSFKSVADFTSLEKLVVDYGTLRWKQKHIFAPFTGVEEDAHDSDEEEDVHVANTQPPLPDLLPASLKELIIFQAPPVIVENLITFETSSRDQHPNLKSVRIHTSKRRVAKVDDYKRLPEIFAEKGIEYAEPPIDMQFPIPQMHDWITDARFRRKTRWNPRDNKYQAFSTRRSYRRFWQEVLQQNPADINGPVSNFRYGFNDELMSYFDEHFDDEEDFYPAGEAPFTPEEDARLAAELQELDQVMGFNAVYGPPVMDPNPDLDDEDEEDDDFDDDDELGDEIVSTGSYDSLTDDSFDHDDDLEDDFDDDGVSSDMVDEELEFHEWKNAAVYYEWGNTC